MLTWIYEYATSPPPPIIASSYDPVYKAGSLITCFDLISITWTNPNIGDSILSDTRKPTSGHFDQSIEIAILRWVYEVILENVVKAVVVVACALCSPACKKRALTFTLTPYANPILLRNSCIHAWMLI
jgi:hypothetical protein